MRSFSIIPHTADVRLSVKADSLAGLFLCALEGMNEILSKGFCKQTQKYPLSLSVKLTSTDKTALLIDFLSEVLTKSNIKHAIFCKAEFTQISETFLRTRLSGTTVDSFEEDIKAVTYHEAEILKNDKGNLETTIIFDI